MPDTTEPAYRAMVTWGVSGYYCGRAHVVPSGDGLALCGLRVHDVTRDRPAERRVCPECALTWMVILYPAVPDDALAAAPTERL